MGNKSIYIVLTRTDTVISKLIQILKKDEYTHAAISLDKNLNHMYSFGRKYTLIPFIGTFKKEDLDKGIYMLSETVPSLVLEIQVSNQQYEMVKTLLNHFISNNTIYKYNYIGLIHNLLKKPVCNDHRFLCSEFVYHILNESGIVDFRTSRNLVRPVNLLEVAGDVFYKGDLKRINKPYETWELSTN